MSKINKTEYTGDPHNQHEDIKKMVLEGKWLAKITNDSNNGFEIIMADKKLPNGDNIPVLSIIPAEQVEGLPYKDGFVMVGTANIFDVIINIVESHNLSAQFNGYDAIMKFVETSWKFVMMLMEDMGIGEYLDNLRHRMNCPCDRCSLYLEYTLRVCTMAPTMFPGDKNLQDMAKTISGSIEMIMEHRKKLIEANKKDSGKDSGFHHN